MSGTDICVPNKPYMRCQRFFSPASAFPSSSSRILIPYCLMQHENGRFAGTTAAALAADPATIDRHFGVF